MINQGFMRKIFAVVFTAFLVLNSYLALAQDSAQTVSRPKVGLVLSGGGAKGAARLYGNTCALQPN